MRNLSEGRGELLMETLRVKTGRRTQLVDVTGLVERAVKASGVVSGVCYVYVPHTTAGVAGNETADPGAAWDLDRGLGRLGPHAGAYRDSEGDPGSRARVLVVRALPGIFVWQ